MTFSDHKDAFRRARCIVTATVALFLFANVPEVNAVPPERLATFERSINVWLNFDITGPSPFEAEPLLTSDIQMLKEHGFTHLRVFLNIRSWLPRFAAQATIDQNLAQLDADLDVWLGEDIAVSLVPAGRSSEIIAEVLGTASGRADLLAFWQQIATRYAARDPELLSFEIFNEPHSITADDCAFNACAPPVWRSYQETFLNAIRAAAPEHTILVTGADFSNYPALMQLTPYGDDNLVYVFHYYYPHTFTFQGLPPNEEVVDLPYPACMPGAQAAVDAIDDPTIRSHAQDYVDEGWSATRIRADISTIADWAANQNVALFANELTAHGQEMDSRTRYIRDVRLLLEEHGIAWSIFSITGVYTQGWIPGGRIPVVDLLRPLAFRPWLLNTPACLSAQTLASDVSLRAIDPNPVIAGQDVSYTVNVQNLGVDTATGLVLRHALPPEHIPVTATPSSGTCNVSLNTVTCDIGLLPNSGSINIDVTASTSGAGLFAAPTIAVANETDPDEANNGRDITITVHNPVPSIDVNGMSPATTIAGGSEFTLMLNGGNFVPSSQLLWNSELRTTTFVSESALAATIDAADVSSGTFVQVSVSNPAPGGGESNAQFFVVNNPIPTTNALLPSKVTAGDQDFTLVVHGTGFTPTSVLRWNGEMRTSTFVSHSELTATIGAADIITGATVHVSVNNSTPGGGESNVIVFTINAAMSDGTEDESAGTSAIGLSGLLALLLAYCGLRRGRKRGNSTISGTSSVRSAFRRFTCAIIFYSPSRLWRWQWR